MASSEHPFFGYRLRIAFLFLILAIGMLASRVWYLQVLHGSHFRDLSENNRTRTVRTLAPRGIIYDRDGRTLVSNRPAFDINLVLEDIQDIDDLLDRLAEISGRDRDVLKEALSSKRRRYAFEPQTVIADVSREELAKIKVKGFDLPGVIVSVTPRRSYPQAGIGAHVLGYPREITSDQLSRAAFKNYRPGDIIGQAGIESSFEQYLKGENGYIRVEVDARGKKRGELGIRDDRSGQDLILTLDLDLQAVAHEALSEEEGSVVAIDPRNGEILVLATSPIFDTNLFATEIPMRIWRELQNDPRKPLIHRAIAGIYSPGSTFKLIMALAGLMEGVVTPQTTINCPGFYQFGGRRYHCHKREGHGAVNLARAITVSCNTFFYQLGQQLRIDRIHEYALMMGLGELSGLELPGERSGIVPSENWKRKVFGERWYPGETLSVSIGQGSLNVSPLQLAISTATLVNGGKYYKPMLVREVIDRELGTVTTFKPELKKDSKFDPVAVNFVKLGAQMVVENAEGTGKRAKVEGISVGGKTGTTQIRALGKESNKREFRDHAWFIAFAPVEEPEIVVAVLIEHGESGGRAAAPVAQRIIEEFLSKKSEREASFDNQPPLESAKLEQAMQEADAG